MPRELVLNMRKRSVQTHQEDGLTLCRRFFQKIARFGLLKLDSDPVDGIFCGEHKEQFKWPQSIRAGDPEWSEDSYPGVISNSHLEAETDQFCGNERKVELTPKLITTDVLALLRRLKPEFKEPFCLRRQLLRTNVPFSKS